MFASLLDIFLHITLGRENGLASSLAPIPSSPPPPMGWRAFLDSLSFLYIPYWQQSSTPCFFQAIKQIDTEHI